MHLIQNWNFGYPFYLRTFLMWKGCLVGIGYPKSLCPGFMSSSFFSEKFGWHCLLCCVGPENVAELLYDLFIW
jgi:hypothetical protein